MKKIILLLITAPIFIMAILFYTIPGIFLPEPNLWYSQVPSRFPENETQYTEKELNNLIAQAQNGDALAQLNLGDYIDSLSSKESKNLPANIGSEREWYLKSANQNNLIACWRMHRYEYDNGPEYVKWLKKLYL